MSYPLLGSLPIVPAADLTDLTADINLHGPGRPNGAFGSNSEGVGKRAGMMVYRDSGSGNHYSLCFAVGPAVGDIWLTCDGVTAYTPA